jgi:hypothetical protein
VELAGLLRRVAKGFSGTWNALVVGTFNGTPVTMVELRRLTLGTLRASFLTLSEGLLLVDLDGTFDGTGLMSLFTETLLRELDDGVRVTLLDLGATAFEAVDNLASA